MSYLHTVGVAVDEFAAALFFNRADLTISSMCYIVRQGTTAQLVFLKPSPAQRAVLLAIGAGLEFFWPGHCKAAWASDLSRAAGVLAVK